MKQLAKLSVLAVCLFVLAPALAEAHRSGCHRWHSCPSDSGSYTCGDLGYPCNYPTYPSSGSTYSSSGSSVYAPTTPTCPLNSYYDGISSCTCNYGYVSSGGSCVSGDQLCHSQTGIFSSYSSLSGLCECDYGYVLNSLGTCEKKKTSYDYAPLYNYSSWYSEAEDSCPAHSQPSVTDSDKCTCDAGYQVSAKGDKCVKKTKKTYDKVCRDNFGPKSQWNKELNEDGDPLCVCKKKYVWSEDGESCVKESY